MVAVMGLVAWWASQQTFFTPQVPALVNGVQVVLLCSVFHGLFLLEGTTPFLTVAVTVVFLFGNFLYVDYAFAFSIGYPFRQPFYNNLAFLAIFVVASALNVVWMFVQTPQILSFWSIVPMPYDFLGALFGTAVAFFAFVYVFEVICSRIVQFAEGVKENRQ